MIRTIIISSHITAQGQFVRTREDGKTEIRCGHRILVGTLI
jgi:hypothetical protein